MSLRRQILHQVVQERIKRFIIDRGYQPGDPLPAEAELARELGVSRPSLREAMKALQAVGVVEPRHGSGTYVGQFSLGRLTDGLAFRARIDLRQRGSSARTLSELLQLRQVVESGLLASVAAVLTADQLADLETIVSRMEARAARGEFFPEEDWAFHEALYRPLGNQLLLELVQAFWDVFALLSDEVPPSAESPVTIAAGHRRILDALRQGDADAAAQAMTDHFFSDIWRRLPAPATAPFPLGSAPTRKGGVPAEEPRPSER